MKNQFELQQEFEQAMLLENTAIADHKEEVKAEYRMEDRAEKAEYENWRNEQYN